MYLYSFDKYSKIFYLYSTKYQTSVPGESLNIIDKIISIDVRKTEEFLFLSKKNSIQFIFYFLQIEKCQ